MPTALIRFPIRSPSEACMIVMAHSSFLVVIVSMLIVGRVALGMIPLALALHAAFPGTYSDVVSAALAVGVASLPFVLALEVGSE